MHDVQVGTWASRLTGLNVLVRVVRPDWVNDGFTGSVADVADG